MNGKATILRNFPSPRAAPPLHHQPAAVNQSIVLVRYEGTWAPDDPDAGFRRMVAEYSRIDPIPTLEVLGRHKGIAVGALARCILSRYCTSGSDALLEMGPRVVHQMSEIVRRAREVGSDDAYLKGYRALEAIVEWLRIPLDDPAWHPREVDDAHRR